MLQPEVAARLRLLTRLYSRLPVKPAPAPDQEAVDP
jgi:hypothetical protein